MVVSGPMSGYIGDGGNSSMLGDESGKLLTAVEHNGMTSISFACHHSPKLKTGTAWIHFLRTSFRKADSLVF